MTSTFVGGLTAAAATTGAAGLGGATNAGEAAADLGGELRMGVGDAAEGLAGEGDLTGGGPAGGGGRGEPWRDLPRGVLVFD